MSMVLYLGKIPADDVDDLLAEPEKIHDLLEELDETGIGLDKNCHAIHFLLTGDADYGEEDVGYGPARVLRPGQVQAFHELLRTIDAAEMRRRFEPAALAAAQVYPEIWDEDEDQEKNLALLLED